MLSVKRIFLLLFAFNLLAAIFIVLDHYAVPANIGKSQLRIETSNDAVTSSKKMLFIVDSKKPSFSNPKLALQVLSLLDVFEPVPAQYFIKKDGVGESKYYKPFLGLKNEDDYCQRHRKFFVENPSHTFEKMFFMSEDRLDSLLRRKVLPELGMDIQPYIAGTMPSEYKNSFYYNLKVSINNFFTTNSMFVYKHLGKHFSCLSQTSNHIPGHSIMNRKDTVAQAAIDYAKKFATRPDCFNYNKFFPETWLLTDRVQCLEFFKKLNSPEYRKLKEEIGIVYMRKVGAGSHRGNGVQPVNEQEEAQLRSMYENGGLCGAVTKNYLVQTYVHNPLLLDGHKFDFRMYMLIASSNPLILYYHDGFLRVSLHQYDISSNDKSVLLTNIALSEDIMKQAKEGVLFDGKDEEELRNSQIWSFNRLKDYLLATGKISDPDWLDNYLRPEFKKAMIHLVRMASHNFFRHSSVYELYGVDYIMDDNLNLWFLEANSGPMLQGGSDEKERFVVKMLKDHYEIVYGLLRSRMKRVIGYVNSLISDGSVIENSYGNAEIKDLWEKRMEFKVITENYFEPEYEPSSDNGFSLIIDENLEGLQKYMGFISAECI